MSLSFGGSDLKSNPKIARPISTKRAMHIVIKTHLKREACNFQSAESKVRAKIKSLCEKWGIKIYRGVVMSTHIHLILRCRSRNSLRHFLREVGSFLGMLFGRGAPLFSGRPFSRIIEWGKDYAATYRYLDLNFLEKLGISKRVGRTLLANLRDPSFCCSVVELSKEIYCMIGR